MTISMLPQTSNISGIQQPLAIDRQALNDLLRAGPSGIMRRKQPDRHPSDAPKAPQTLTPPNPAPATNTQPQAPSAEASKAPQTQTTPGAAPTSNAEPPAPGADTPKLNRIRELTSRENITQMLREPHSLETASQLAEIRSLLSKENVKALLQGPNADEARKLITEVKARLDQSSLQTIHDRSSHIPSPGLSPQEIRDRTSSSDPEESANQVRQIESEMRIEESYAKQRVRKSTPLASALFDIGKGLEVSEPTPQPESPPPTADNLKPNKDYSNSNTSNTSNTNNSIPRYDEGQTFTFHSIRESNFDAPKEVIDFDHNKDKLVVSAIRNQLGNKPLKLVENFSGASGEVQIHYSPANNTSVVMIAGNPGEPPFVVKVFGEVRYSNLTT